MELEFPLPADGVVLKQILGFGRKVRHRPLLRRYTGAISVLTLYTVFVIPLRRRLSVSLNAVLITLCVHSDIGAVLIRRR
jgi:hypothetical protein